MTPRYISPYTDFGFKKLFGEEASKPLLKDFLNTILPDKHKIAELQFKNTENLPASEAERRAVFDVYCTSLSGERFIVEMQRARTAYFKDRALYYSTFPIRDQAEPGGWKFKLAAVYFVAIMDFVDDPPENRKFRRDVVLKDQDGDVFTDKLQFTFLQMPLFTKTETELESRFDKWIYFLKNLEDFNNIPFILNEPIFEQGFEIAELGKLDPEIRQTYEISRMKDNDNQNALDFAREDGREEGREEGRKETNLSNAREMKSIGMSVEQIVRVTGISREEI